MQPRLAAPSGGTCQMLAKVSGDGLGSKTRQEAANWGQLRAAKSDSSSCAWIPMSGPGGFQKKELRPPLGRNLCSCDCGLMKTCNTVMLREENHIGHPGVHPRWDRHSRR